jgi:hypothetical protein
MKILLYLALRSYVLILWPPHLKESPEVVTGLPGLVEMRSLLVRILCFMFLAYETGLTCNPIGHLPVNDLGRAWLCRLVNGINNPSIEPRK